MLKQLLAVFIGGGVGSVLRYAVQILLHERIVPYNFPWATFSVNVVGCFLIGLFNLSAEVRLLLTAGLCGGFTTFSTFCNDNLLLLKQGDLIISIFYIIFSVVLGIVACFCGSLIAKL